ncbi:MarR family transcriptional regulator [Blastopirellula sp. J2-11]|uniref:helix-turn-helix transcriptional regulator n=1 Tax=Blastopirellula sp. J2-11 TaxID=2943192 RepID=UPI0021C78AE8|nr:MarR family transcriptional regulator [Blastopirellula sp. J2-11]UUO08940.1 MarR family transcriptional regulator [Blastopirellula sp. J2-11]
MAEQEYISSSAEQVKQPASDPYWTQEVVPSDIVLLDLLRNVPHMTIAVLAGELEVTATAVRQRLNRLMAQGYVERFAEKSGRGRPIHHYRLSEKGKRKGGGNFADLAVALWQEVRSIKDPAVRRGLLQRISERLVAQYAEELEGIELDEKLRKIAEIFGERRIPIQIEQQEGELPVLNVMACPYPGLAELDQSICAMEKIMFSEMLGSDVRLGKCRLNGESCCSFELS